jgi:hypothetical protein
MDYWDNSFCSRAPASVLAHELGHTFGFNHSNDGSVMTPVACNSGTNCVFTQSQKDYLLSLPWFAPPAPIAKTTVQGIKVVGSGNSLTSTPALNNVDIVYLDGAGWGSSADQDRHKVGSDRYTYANIPQGLHRLGIYNIPAGWEVFGYTKCEDATNCHTQTPTPMSPNPLAWYTNVPSVVFDSRGHPLEDIYFHFRQIQTQNTDDSFLKVNVTGAPAGTAHMDAGPRAFTDSEPAHDVGRCGKSFSVNGSLTCSGVRMGPISISPQQYDGYTVKWSGCDATSPSGNSCWMRLYDSGTKAVTVTYVSNNSGGTYTPGGIQPSTPTDPNANFSFAMAIQAYKAADYNANSKVVQYLPSTHNINFDWGGGTPLPGTQPDWYLVGWSGTFTSPGSGTYTFYSEEDDAFAVQMVSAQNPFTIDAWNGPWTGHPQTSAHGTISLTKGQKVPILVYFTEFTGAAKAKLYWSGPGITGRPLFPNLR